jgi:hypothetical protein
MGLTFVYVAQINGVPEEFIINNYQIDIETVKKYEFDKENPVNRRKRIQFGSYYETTIDIKPLIDINDYDDFKKFLDETQMVVDEDSGLGLYIKFDTKNGVLAYPIKNITLPRISDDHLFLEDFSQIKIISEYSTEPHIPEFLLYGDGNYGGTNFGY